MYWLGTKAEYRLPPLQDALWISSESSCQSNVIQKVQILVEVRKDYLLIQVEGHEGEIEPRSRAAGNLKKLEEVFCSLLCCICFSWVTSIQVAICRIYRLRRIIQRTEIVSFSAYATSMISPAPGLSLRRNLLIFLSTTYPSVSTYSIQLDTPVFVLVFNHKHRSGLISSVESWSQATIQMALSNVGSPLMKSTTNFLIKIAVVGDISSVNIDQSGSSRLGRVKTYIQRYLLWAVNQYARCSKEIRLKPSQSKIPVARVSSFMRSIFRRKEIVTVSSSS